MFLLTSIHDTIPVAPCDFGKDPLQVLTKLIENKYVDKVVHDVGLIVGFYDITNIKESVVRPGDGRAHYKLDFRLITFKPFKGEIIEGTLIASDPSGLKVSIDFFQDIKIHQSSLREPKEFDAEERLWWWEFEGHRLYYEHYQPVIFRVSDVCFNKKDGAANRQLIINQDTYLPPMVVIGSIDEDGLGMKAWWE